MTVLAEVSSNIAISPASAAMRRKSRPKKYASPSDVASQTEQARYAATLRERLAESERQANTLKQLINSIRNVITQHEVIETQKVVSLSAQNIVDELKALLDMHTHPHVRTSPSKQSVDTNRQSQPPNRTAKDHASTTMPQEHFMYTDSEHQPPESMNMSTSTTKEDGSLQIEILSKNSFDYRDTAPEVVPHEQPIATGSENQLPESASIRTTKNGETSQTGLTPDTPLDSPSEEDTPVRTSLQTESTTSKTHNLCLAGVHLTESGEESEQSSSMDDNMSFPVQKTKKRGRRRTMAVVKSRTLLQQQDEDKASPCPQFALTSTPSEESYNPSSATSSAFQTADEDQKLQIKADHDHTGSQGIKNGVIGQGKKSGNYSNATLDERPNSEVPFLRPLCDSDATTSNPPRRMEVQRSGVRNTVTVHKGTILLAHSTPDSLFSGTPSSDQTLLPVCSSTARNAATESTSSIAFEIRRFESAVVEKQSSSKMKQNSSLARVNESTSFKSVAKSVSVRRSPRKNDVAYDQGVKEMNEESTPVCVAASTPFHTATKISTIRRSPRITKAKLSPNATSNMQQEISPSSVIRTTPSTKVIKESVRRSRRASIMPEKFREKDIIVMYQPRANLSESIASNLPLFPNESKVMEPTHDDSTLIVGESEVALTESERVVDSGTPHGLTPFPHSKDIAHITAIEDVSGPRQPKARRKRRSSVGVNFNGGLITSKDFEGVMHETMSRKRNRRRHEDRRQSGEKDENAHSTSNMTINTDYDEEIEMADAKLRALRKPAIEDIRLVDATDTRYTGRLDIESMSEVLLKAEFLKQEIPTITEEVNASVTVELKELHDSIVAQVKSNNGFSAVDSHTTAQLSTLSKAEITGRIRSHFPEQGAVSMPCVSARIFACFTLVAEKSSLSPVKSGTRTRRNRSCRHVQVLLPLLQAIARAELSSLGTADAKADIVQAAIHKRVQFCGIDASSSRPPVDSVAGSHIHLEESIHALHAAVQEAHSLCNLRGEVEAKDNDHEVNVQINALIRFLQDFEGNLGGDMRDACAESMPCLWPSQRFVNAARLLRIDCVYILAAVAENRPIGRNGESLVLEQRLADFVGRSVRFYLRKFFNPLPLPLTTDEKVDVSIRSRIHETLEMIVTDESSRDTAVADGSISSVFSTAVRHIYVCFGLEMLSSDYPSLKLKNQFCRSNTSIAGVGTKKNPIILQEADVQNVLSDINETHIFLAAARSCKFLMDLLRWPGVMKEVQRVGGWTTVEECSSMISEFDLERACEDDAFFVLLRDINMFSEKVEAFWLAMEPQVAVCEETLRRQWKRFRCGTNSQKVLEQNPCIRIIADALREGSHLVFPSLSTPIEE